VPGAVLLSEEAFKIFRRVDRHATHVRHPVAQKHEPPLGRADAELERIVVAALQ